MFASKRRRKGDVYRLLSVSTSSHPSSIPASDLFYRSLDPTMISNSFLWPVPTLRATADSESEHIEIARSSGFVLPLFDGSPQISDLLLD